MSVMALASPAPQTQEEHTSEMRVNAAAAVALREYPGAVGTFLAQELRQWSDFGRFIGGHGLVALVCRQLLTQQHTRTLGTLPENVA